MRHRPELATVGEVLRWRAAEQPDSTAFTWGADDEVVELTYGELDRRARAIAALLQDEGPAGQRALLLLPPGLGFVAAIFGCFYAGWIAVPAYPPPLNQRMDRVRTVACDAQPRVALTSGALLGQVQARLADEPALERLRWRTIDAVTSCERHAGVMPPSRDRHVGPDDVAVLQYTSGSTATPRGVMLTHANLLHNTAQIEKRFGIVDASESRGVIWLPPYHDMGLVGGILEGVFAGFPISLMAPVAFLQRPRRWLEAITRTRATISGGPNFAYDLCVDRIPTTERGGLDLSSWQVAFNGSEPVRETTLRRFTDAFAPFGFRPTAFYPCYGLAEATLMVSGGCSSAPPVLIEYAAGADRRMVGCGHSIDDQEIVIVEPSTRTPCAPGQVGEVWVRGPSVAAGYWNRPELTDEVFRAELNGSLDTRSVQPHDAAVGVAARTAYSEEQFRQFAAAGGQQADHAGLFLRTGDLGFFQDDGELFITGRLKAALILGGRKIQAEDIEVGLAEAQTTLRPARVVALSVDAGGEERLVIVKETVARTAAELDAIARAIRLRVAETHLLPVWSVILTRPGGVPKTSSGKVQRAACRDAFLNQQLEPVYAWRASDAKGRIEP